MDCIAINFICINSYIINFVEKMKLKNWSVAIFVIIVILTKNLAFGCFPIQCMGEFAHTCRRFITRGKSLPMQGEDGGLSIGSFLTKVSSLFAFGIKRV